MENRRRQASPVELAALLMEAACRTTPQEEDALAELAARSGGDTGRLRYELMYLRAFAVDQVLALEATAGAGQAQLMAHYRHHWTHLDGEVPGVADELAERLNRYLEAAQTDAASSLSERIGLAFASLCGVDEAYSSELAAFGGSLFSAMYEELSRLFDEVEVVPASASDRSAG